MFRLILLACLVLGINSLVHGQMTIDLDLDGIPGNGPDTVVVAVGDTVDIDLWFLGDSLFVGYTVEVCGLDTARVAEVTHCCTGSWVSGDISIGATCTRIFGVTFGAGLSMPHKNATIEFEARCEGGPGPIEAFIDSAVVSRDNLMTFEIESTTPAYIAVDCGTATEAASWSDVKALFR